MPSPSVMHEGILQPFADRPTLAAELLVDALGVKLPADWQARVISAELTQLVPTQYLADLVVVASGSDGPALAVVLEVQLDPDDQKRYSWPVYLANLRARLRCPTVLLTITPRPATARWCADPIELGPGSVVTPVVLGPEQLPLLTDPAAARRVPELAVLSALTHGGTHPQRHQVLTAFLSAVRTLAKVDPERAEIYHDVVAAVLPTAARAFLERLMDTKKTYQFKSEWHLSRIKRGQVEGTATALLAVLKARGIEVPDEARQRILDCTDIDRLGWWVHDAGTAESIEDLQLDKQLDW